MQVTINYDPHSADDMAKLAEMFSASPSQKAFIAEARESLAAHTPAEDEVETEEKPAIDFKKRLKREEAEAKRLENEAQENTESDPVDLNTVKALAIEAIKAGKRAEVLAKLKELGAPTVTKLPAKHYVQMYNFLNALMAEA